MSQNRAPGGVNSRFYMSDEERANQPKVTRALLERILSYFKPYTGKLLLLLLTIAVTSFRLAAASEFSVQYSDTRAGLSPASFVASCASQKAQPAMIDRISTSAIAAFHLLFMVIPAFLFDIVLRTIIPNS